MTSLDYRIKFAKSIKYKRGGSDKLLKLRMYPTLHFFNFNIDSYSILSCIAIITATCLIRYELKRLHFPRFLFIELLLVGVIPGFIGSKLYYCLSNWNEFIADPSSIIFSFYGSGWFGGFFLGGLSIVIFLKIRNYPVLKTLDVIIPALPCAQAVGRLGCFFSGDGCYGVPSDLPWAMAFPNGLVPTEIKVHPTPLYETIIYFSVFILLWKLRKKEIPAGFKLSQYLVIASIGRFAVEFIRLNPDFFLGLTLPQIASILSILLGISIVLSKSIKEGSLQIK